MHPATNSDGARVTVTFTPDSGNPDDKWGTFTFSIDDMIAVRERLFALRLKQGKKKGKQFLQQQTHHHGFDWNVWIAFSRPARTLLHLIDMGLGTVHCPECTANYPTTELIVYEWTRQNWGGLQYACPHDHILFTPTTSHGEFFHPDDRRFVRVKREK